MRFSTLFAATAIAVSGVTSSPVTVQMDVASVIGFDLTIGNHYGAPNAPWIPGAKPGWYYGSHPEQYLHHPFPCLWGIICHILDLFPYVLHCPKPPPHQPNPPPSDGYHQSFSNLTGATQAADYLTFGLVDTVADCKSMCNSITGCGFANTYHDVNGKDGSTQLTCSLYTKCHDASDATNTGGQSQPDGTIDYIVNSNGWCKD